MKYKERINSVTIGNIKVKKSLETAILKELFNGGEVNFLPVSKHRVAKVVGKDKLNEIKKTSRRLRYFSCQGYLFIKDGDTITYFVKDVK